jgi:hypothetical protein
MNPNIAPGTTYLYTGNGILFGIRRARSSAMFALQWRHMVCITIFRWTALLSMNSGPLCWRGFARRIETTLHQRRA